MYRLFLCFRYLKSRVIAYFAVLGVALCVAMVLIVISVMNGFLDKIENATRGLFGDVVISATSRGGLARYEELIVRIKEEVPGAKATPFVLTYGLIRVPEQDYRKDVQLAGIRLAGPGGPDGGPMDYYTDVSDFERGLFVQEGHAYPSFFPSNKLVLQHLERDMDYVRELSAEYAETPSVQDAAETAEHFHIDAARIIERRGFVQRQIAQVEALQQEADTSDGAPEDVERLHNAVRDRLDEIRPRFPDLDRTLGQRYYRIPWGEDRDDPTAEKDIEKLRRFIADMLQSLRTKLWRRGTDAELRRQEAIRDLIGRFEELARSARPPEADIPALRQATAERMAELRDRLPAHAELHDRYAGIEWTDDPAADRATLLSFLRDAMEELRRAKSLPDMVILGMGIPGMSTRTPEGETIRKIVPGNTVGIMLVPLGRKYVSGTSITPVSSLFSVADDCRTDVSSIDQSFVYLPFETLQELNQMGEERAPDGSVVRPARCSQIFVKLPPAHAEGEDLLAATARIRRLLHEFEKEHPDFVETGGGAVAETWRQRHAQVIGPIQKQRTLAVIMFSIISMVSVVLVFVIFYMIVVQKTRDIGVVKAIGGSNAGVACIFLSYGAAIGLIGSVLGTVGGYLFVRNINPIQDAIARWYGFQVWDPEVFLFEKIPNQVDPRTATAIIVAAIAAGILGAVIPAFRAARMQPVEALRYE